jgi:DNA-binding CsgD family transcriptional regulator
MTGLDALTPTERSILDLYARGLSRDEISRLAGLSRHTVGHALTTAKEKLHARSLAHAVFLYTIHVNAVNK